MGDRYSKVVGQTSEQRAELCSKAQCSREQQTQIMMVCRFVTDNTEWVSCYIKISIIAALIKFGFSSAAVSKKVRAKMLHWSVFQMKN